MVSTGKYMSILARSSRSSRLGFLASRAGTLTRSAMTWVVHRLNTTCRARLNSGAFSAACSSVRTASGWRMTPSSTAPAGRSTTARLLIWGMAAPRGICAMRICSSVSWITSPLPDNFFFMYVSPLSPTRNCEKGTAVFGKNRSAPPAGAGMAQPPYSPRSPA